MSSSSTFSKFTARLREFITTSTGDLGCGTGKGLSPATEGEFDQLARQLFELQFHHNSPYRQLCDARHVSPATLTDWRKIPEVPTAAFKELELSCLPPGQRTAAFHSSGTTAERPSRHFHNAESLAIYDASLLPSFRAHVLPELEVRRNQPLTERGSAVCHFQFAILTPPPAQAPHSSLIHMFETIRCDYGAKPSVFCGSVGADGTWSLDSRAACELMRRAGETGQPAVILGTAFSFVHLLDYLAEQHEQLKLPPGSRAMETGGYKGRSRSLPRAELHELITRRLGIPQSHIVCEYGMSELSSQAYDHQIGTAPDPKQHARTYCFPPWSRAQIISPETGYEVTDGETGLIRVLDLANVYSVMAIQTEDIGIRRGDGFELIGRARLAEPRGCSLMASSIASSC